MDIKLIRKIQRSIQHPFVGGSCSEFSFSPHPYIHMSKGWSLRRTTLPLSPSNHFHLYMRVARFELDPSVFLHEHHCR